MLDFSWKIHQVQDMTWADRLNARRQELGWSKAELARRTGVPYDNINKYLRGDVDQPRGDVLHKLALGTGVSLLWLRDGIAPKDIVASGTLTAAALEEAPSSPPPTPNVDASRIATQGLVGAADLPVYTSAQGGTGEMVMAYDPIEWVKRPEPLMRVRNGFAMYVVGDSMSPAFEPGDLLLCHPDKPPHGGDDVMLVLRNGDTGSHEALVKRLVRSTAEGFRLKQFNPPRDDIFVERERVESIALVVGKYSRR